MNQVVVAEDDFKMVDTCCKCNGLTNRSEWLGRMYGSRCARIEPICEACYITHKQSVFTEVGHYLDNHGWEMESAKYYWLSLLLSECETARVNSDNQ
jgi:hypothetical protein